MNILPSMRLQAQVLFIAITCLLFISSCTGQVSEAKVSTKVITPGIANVYEYMPMLAGKKVGVVVNHTSVIDDVHLVDTLLSGGVKIGMIFSPEHGFKGSAYNGEEVDDDMYLGRIKIRSIYGKSKKPAVEDFSQLDVVIFDIQDVGARFYTYISTLHYVMETAAEANIPVIILDRPNPNAHYIDGPMLEPEYKSFIGMHPVPAVYGMTIGEYGKMINGEAWLPNQLKCKLTVIPCGNYNHSMRYDLPVPPSPNLPNALSVALYPSLCFIEGTSVSAGRGTDMQFQIYGHPALNSEEFSYTPTSRSSSKYPKHQDELCGGVDLRSREVDAVRAEKALNLSYIIDAYQKLKSESSPFFLKNNFINKLAGTDQFKKQIESGMTEEEIRSTWDDGLEQFKKTRSKYLIYI